MKANHSLFGKLSLALPVAWAAVSLSLQAQTTTWNGFGGDSDWNTALNWDLGLPAEGTTAVIGAGSTVNYNAPMVASSINALWSAGVLNVNAAGLVAAAAGDGAVGFVGSGAKLFLNQGGALSLPNGGLTLSNAAGLSVAAGSSLSVGGNLLLGRNATGNTGFATNHGGLISAAATTVNPNNNSSTSLLLINGGTNDLGAVTIKRSVSSSGFASLGAEGLIINNGVVRMASLDVGGAEGNSYLTMSIANGAVTNTGDTIVRQVTANRGSRFLQSGGLFVCAGANGVNLRGHSANNAIVIYSVTGGTNLPQGFVLGNPAGTDTTGTVRLTNAANIYIGSGGITSIGRLNTRIIALNHGGVFGAQADWAGTEPILLAGGAFDAASLDGTPHHITLSGVLSGNGMNKNGAGTLTLNAVNTYSGNTLINQGTLALGPSGSIANSPQIILASGAALDVSAVNGFTVGGARTLAGSGSVTGDVAVASGGLLNPGSSAGTLTLGNSLTMTGGAVLHFDLPTAPGLGNDRLVVNGDLNVSGGNTLEIVGGGSPGTVHTLIQYGGNFNGTLANFSLSGASGVLSNNTAAKTIALVIQSAVRSPTNVVWVGNPLVNDWDTVNHTNWLNTGTGLLDYCVTGDHVLFDDTGAAQANVNLAGNVAPATVTVAATAHYTFGGSGAISGAANLIKTNTGTLTITSTNSYTGITILSGGVLETALLANGGFPSAIGAANPDPANLVLDGGALRYTGESVGTDRGATISAGGGLIEVSAPGTVLTANGTLSGTGAVIKAGSGTLALAAANNYAGGTVLSNGTLQLNHGAGAGTGGITNYGVSMRVSGAIAVDNVLHFNNACTLELTGVGSGNVALRGAWIGDGTVAVNFLAQNTSQTLSLGGEGLGGGTMWDFAGTLDLGTNRGFCRLNNNGSINFGSSNAVFNLGTGDVVFCQRNGGTTTHLGALLGGPDTRLSGARNDVSGITTYSIGGKNLDTVFAGSITNGQSGSSIRPAAIIKVGTGKLTLTGTSSYTGTTTLEGGTLQVDGSLGNTPVTVVGGILAGSGTIEGSVDVQYGGTLSPGSTVGAMSIGNTLTLQPGSITMMEIDKGSGSSDSVVGLVNVIYGGTLVVTNLSGTLAEGDTFYLFPGAGAYFGNFESFALPALANGLAWDTSNLAVNGSLAVVAGDSRPLLGVVQNGNALQFSWTGNYKLQAQTNALTIGLSTNWYDYPGGAISPVTVSVDATAPTVFFRLSTP